MFQIESFDIIIVPLSTDSIVLNLHYKTNKFISFSEIFFQDTFKYNLRLHFNVTEEKLLKKICADKRVAFVQLPSIYGELSQYLVNLKCVLIFLSNKNINIIEQITCENLLDEVKYIQEYSGNSQILTDTTKDDMLYRKKEDSKDAQTLYIHLQHLSDHDMLFGSDHHMLNMLLSDRCAITTLWETSFGQKLYNMARYLFYHDEHTKDSSILLSLDTKDIEGLNGLRYYINALSSDALFTEQLKYLGANDTLLGSFIRFATLHYQHLHVHYLTLLTAFLKHKYCLRSDIDKPIYPMHTLRFFSNPLILSGFVEQDEYYDFTLQTIHTGNPLILIRTNMYIEHISHIIPLNYSKHIEAQVSETPILSTVKVEVALKTEYTLEEFVALTHAVDKDHIDDVYKLNAVLYRLFSAFVNKQDLQAIYQDQSPFDLTLLKSMFNVFIEQYDNTMIALGLSPLEIGQQWTHLYADTTIFDYPVYLKSYHYYMQARDEILLMFISFGSNFNLSRKTLLQMYTASKYYGQETKKSFIYINMEGYKEVSFDTILTGCKGYITDVFGLKSK